MANVKIRRKGQGTGEKSRRRELRDESLLMMTPYTLIARYREIKL